MVARKNINSYALISVYDKTFLKKICLVLTKYNIGIISTGSTAKKIISLGFYCTEVSDLTKFKEILDGRVKTLNPKIHASILYKRNNEIHKQTFKKLKFPRIDFVIVNFYPFLKVPNIAKQSKKIEMIDIGGPSLVRSASKNFEFVTTVCGKKYYNKFIKELQNNNGKTTLFFRKKMAEYNFKLTSEYDLSIFKWFNRNKKNRKENKIEIKYGENQNQRAFFLTKNKNNIFNAKICGKDLGYNNILDVDEGLNCLSEFNEPTCVIIKHNNPCGVGSAKNINKAYFKALESDPVSAFGGVVLLNKKVKPDLAKILSSNFFEIIVAPSFEKKSLEILQLKKKLILIDCTKLKRTSKISSRSLDGGTLFQEKNSYKTSRSTIKLVTKKESSEKTINDLIFAYKVAKHVKSNAIVFVNNKQTIGIGAGQMSRIDSTRVAIMKYKDFFKDKVFVCASDAFFPFTDNVKKLLKLKCKAIIQPSGSKNDKKIIDYVKKLNSTLYFVKNRVFKH